MASPQCIGEFDGDLRHVNDRAVVLCADPAERLQSPQLQAGRSATPSGAAISGRLTRVSKSAWPGALFHDSANVRYTELLPVIRIAAMSQHGDAGLKGLIMTPQFLRAEAARFREMAEQVTDREASRQRLLKMATDYEDRARIADANQPARPDPEPEVESEPETEQASEEPAKAKPVRRIGGTRLTLRRPSE